MQIIDDKGRLFGIINIIDLIVLLLLLIAVAVGIGKFTGRGARHEPGTVKVDLEVIINEVRQQTVSAIEVGDVVFDSTGGGVFGTITDKRVVPFRQPVRTPDGSLALADVPERYTIYLDLECDGHDLGNVLRVASYEIRIGTSVILQTRDYSIGGNVLKVEIEEPQ